MAAIVWGPDLVTVRGSHIVWSSLLDEHIVWGSFESDEHVVWGTIDVDDHIVWGTILGRDSRLSLTPH
jgi:hypothetical protein